MDYSPPFARYPWSMRWSVPRYQHLKEAGIIGPHDSVELIEGYLLVRSARTAEHAAAVRRMGVALATPPGWVVRTQLPVVFADSLFEPDFAIVPSGADGSCGAIPHGIEVGFCAEVLNSPDRTSTSDRLRIAAYAGVPVYWIVNLDDRRVEVHTRPSGPCDSPAYASVVHYASGDSVPLVLDGTPVATVPVADLLP